MTAIEAFNKQFGKAAADPWLIRAGTHEQASPVPDEGDQRLFYALLEAIDWQCFEYKDAPDNITEAQAKAFLVKHKDKITCEPPSYVGVLAGAYDFLTVKQNS